MPGMLIGYARVLTDEQDLTAKGDALGTLGVAIDRVNVDHAIERDATASEATATNAWSSR
ncbi:MAG: hypothetical protein QOG56_475 [Solirubrobacteraceae bacterium]|jgi:hypothetical protein|nr:hypothetical protein [Solirubrobacteraceae bacterium]